MRFVDIPDTMAGRKRRAAQARPQDDCLAFGCPHNPVHQVAQDLLAHAFDIDARHAHPRRWAALDDFRVKARTSDGMIRLEYNAVFRA